MGKHTFFSLDYRNIFNNRKNVKNMFELCIIQYTYSTKANESKLQSAL